MIIKSLDHIKPDNKWLYTQIFSATSVPKLLANVYLVKETVAFLSKCMLIGEYMLN